MFELEVHGNVRLLRMTADENRFDSTFVGALHRVLDSLEAVTGPCALVTTGTDRFYSNGLDLDFFNSLEDKRKFLHEVHGLFARILALDMYTVAAVSGHAFAGGAMLAVSHDHSVMRFDRGYWCIPEVDLGLPLTPEMYAVLSARIDRPALAEAILTGKRYTASEAAAVRIVDEVASRDELVDRALEVAAGQATKDRSVLRIHKRLLYSDVLDAVGETTLQAHGR